jgi:hypothetical protein
MPRKPLASSWGKTAPAAPVRQAQEELPADPVDRELVLAIRRVGRVEALKRLQESGGAGDGAVPPPSTAQEVANLANAASGIAKNAVDIAKAQADVALDEADRERRRRQEAEQKVGDAYESGRQEGISMIELVREISDGARTAIEKAYEVRLAAKDSEFSGQLAALSAKLDNVLATHQAELARKDERIQQLEQQIQQVQQRPPNEYEELGRAFVQPILERVKTHGVRALEPEPAPAAPQPEDPDTEFRRHLAKELPAEIVARHRSQRENEEMLAAEKAELLRMGKKAIPTILGIARSLVGGPTYNGFPRTVEQAEQFDESPEGGE